MVSAVRCTSDDERERERERKKKNLTGKACPRRLCQLSLRVVNLTADRSQRATYAWITGVPRSSIRLADRAVIFTPFLRRFLSLVAILRLPLPISFSRSAIFVSRSAGRARVVNLEIARNFFSSTSNYHRKYRLHGIVRFAETKRFSGLLPLQKFRKKITDVPYNLIFIIIFACNT